MRTNIGYHNNSKYNRRTNNSSNIQQPTEYNRQVPFYNTTNSTHDHNNVDHREHGNNYHFRQNRGQNPWT